MRRIVSLLFLLCFAWVQAAAAACAMSRGGVEAHASGSAAHASHSAHADHGGGEERGRPHEHSRSHEHGGESVDCGMRIPCGAIAVPTAGAGMTRAPLLVFRSPLGEPDPYASPSLSADPPPPRAEILS